MRRSHRAAIVDGMASHFGTIGLEVTNREEYETLLLRLHSLGTADGVGDQATRVVWRGEAGERVELEIAEDGALTYVLPALEPRGQPVPVRRVRLAPDGTAHLELLDGEDGELICPLPVELTDRVELRALPEPVERGALRLSALAESVTLHTDADAYDASQGDRKPHFAPEHLVPVGLFRPEDSDEDWLPSAHAQFAGEVIATERAVSELTGAGFHRLRVRTLGRIEVDVAVAAGQLDGQPAVGQWLVGQFFMTGTLGLSAPPVTVER